MLTDPCQEMLTLGSFTELQGVVSFSLKELPTVANLAIIRQQSIRKTNYDTLLQTGRFSFKQATYRYFLGTQIVWLTIFIGMTSFLLYSQLKSIKNLHFNYLLVTRWLTKRIKRHSECCFLYSWMFVKTEFYHNKLQSY